MAAKPGCTTRHPVNSEDIDDVEVSEVVEVDAEVLNSNININININSNSNSNSNPEQANITNADTANNLDICKHSVKLGSE